MQLFICSTSQQYEQSVCVCVCVCVWEVHESKAVIMEIAENLGLAVIRSDGWLAGWIHVIFPKRKWPKQTILGFWSILKFVINPCVININFHTISFNSRGPFSYHLTMIPSNVASFHIFISDVNVKNKIKKESNK